MKDGKIVVNGSGKPILCDTCPCVCPPTGSTLTATLSDVVSCGCLYANKVDTSPLTSISGMAAYNVSPFYAGPFSLVNYLDKGCSEIEFTYTGFYSLVVICEPTWWVVYIEGFLSDGGGGDFMVFYADGSGALPKTAISNIVTCNGSSLMGGGTITLSW